MSKILIVDDEPGVRYSFRKLFSGNQYHLHEAQNADQALEMISTLKPDLVLLDIEMPGKSGIDALQEIKQIEPFLPVIIMTAYGSGDRVIKAMKYGAYEYIEKPFDIPRLISLVEEALKSTLRETDETIVLDNHHQKRKKQPTETTIVGESPAIKEVFKLIGRVAASDATILILGESGTGKELVANAIHRYSDRASKPFLAVNCAAIPENLLETELFGHEKGAFTGADRQKSGRFEEANGGTLFLDEIGDMSFALQAKILRVLQEGTFEKVGSTKSQSVDVRVIAATNRNLENDVSQKSFREDLYYRLKVVTITLPPLRIRSEDIPLLSKHFLVKHAREARASNISIHPDAMEAMQQYAWPGNIRELENCIKRCLILAKGNIITKELITKEFQTEMITPGKHDLRIDAYLTKPMTKSEGEIYRLVVEEVEKDLLQWALRETNGNRAQAARMLGISRVMLHERIEKYRNFLQ